LVIFVASLFIVPQVTFAAWWNPGTWKIFNRKSIIKQTIVATSTPNKIEKIRETTSSTTSKTEDSSIKNTAKSADNLGAEAGEPAIPAAEKKQESVLPKTSGGGGGALIVGVTSGPRPVNPVISISSQEREEKKIKEIQNQIDGLKKNIEQMAATVNSWKTDLPVSTQFYNYRSVGIRIFELPGDGGYRIEFANPENSQNIQEHIQKIDKGELNKKIEQIVDSILPKNPAVMAIDAFLLNPTIDNLISFCNIAKTAQGTEQKKVLNETRTDFVMKTLTLYEQDQINNLCNHAFSIRKLKSDKYLSQQEFQAYFQWITYNPSYLLEFNSNDSDTVRGIKIDFNNYWK
ncbi:MAG: hypothetical protein AABX39_05985, partial [Nanoarchaeota archaeon]